MSFGSSFLDRSSLLHVLFLAEVVLLLLTQCLLLVRCLLRGRLDDSIDWSCCLPDWGVLLVGHLLLLLLASYAVESTVVDMYLHMELHQHAELEGVVSVAVVVALEGRGFCLVVHLETVAVLEHLVLMELLLWHVLHFVDIP